MSVRVFRVEEWRTYRGLRLRALADSPDAFGSTLALEQSQPDSWWKERLKNGVISPANQPLVAELGEDPVGLAWGRIEDASPERADLYQMWVGPQARRLGFGQMLLDGIIAWARSADARYLALGVTCGDTPARRLYARAGFVAFGPTTPLRPDSALRGQEMRIALSSVSV